MLRLKLYLGGKYMLPGCGKHADGLRIRIIAGIAV